METHQSPRVLNTSNIILKTPVSLDTIYKEDPLENGAVRAVEVCIRT